MLAMISAEITRTLELDLDIEKVVRFALCHDLIEIETGDIPTFSLSPEELSLKEQREQTAKHKLFNRLPPGIAADLEEYEEQTSDEAIFIRTLDKILPVLVDIIGQGKRVMREDYGITTHQEARLAHDTLHERTTKKFGERNPELIGAHALVCAMFVEQYTVET